MPVPATPRAPLAPGLRARLALLFAGVVVVTVAAVGLALVRSAEDELRAEVDEFLVRRARELTARPGTLLDGTGPRDPRPRIGDVLAADFDAVTQLVDADGSIVVTLADNPVLPVDETDVALARGGGSLRLRDATVDGEHHRIATAPLERGGAVQIGRDLEEVDTALAGLRTRAVQVGLLAAAAAAGLGWLVARRTVRPVEQLAVAAEHVAETEELAGPIEVSGRRDEVGRLGESFNAMLAALEASRRQQHRLVQDASHELRTPLTSLRTNLELLARADEAGLPADDRRRLLADVNAELVELGALVSELVELATDRHRDEPRVEVDLAALVEEVAARARRRTGRAVVVRVEAPVVLEGRAGRLERAVRNLVDNADKFAPDGTPIEVTVRGGRIAVRDHGPGIPATDRARVFDRFHRADEARTVPGSGLGLAIVDQVAREHGGRPFAEDAPDGGAVVGFDLPVSEEPGD